MKVLRNGAGMNNFCITLAGDSNGSIDRRDGSPRVALLQPPAAAAINRPSSSAKQKKKKVNASSNNDDHGINKKRKVAEARRTHR